uniref:Uncharacterized protein n=1 Tax=Pundamilia nyererei TaxID=303518 RepID=A0A3B4ER06_9CICH
MATVVTSTRFTDEYQLYEELGNVCLFVYVCVCVRTPPLSAAAVVLTSNRVDQKTFLSDEYTLDWSHFLLDENSCVMKWSLS